MHLAIKKKELTHGHYLRLAGCFDVWDRCFDEGECGGGLYIHEIK